MPVGFPLSRRALLFGAVATPVLAARPDPLRGLVEPHMRLAPSADPIGAPRVALTLDACDGAADLRILRVLEDEAIPATIFVTGIWLRRNPEVFRRLLARPDLFEIGDHGAHHHAAIDRPERLWGVVQAAGSPEAIASEVTVGADLIEKAGAPRPKWYRGAAAFYSPQALGQIVTLGYRIAGFSLNADGGASLGAAETAARIARARDGDVLIAHVNQPHRPSGAGVVEGVRALKTKGFRFVRLSDPDVTVIPST